MPVMIEQFETVRFQTLTVEGSEHLNFASLKTEALEATIMHCGTLILCIRPTFGKYAIHEYNKICYENSCPEINFTMKTN